MRYTTDIRDTREGGETAGGSVSGRWSLVASVEILGCPGPTVPQGGGMYGTLEIGVHSIFGSLDLRILSVFTTRTF